VNELAELGADWNQDFLVFQRGPVTAGATGSAAHRPSGTLPVPEDHKLPARGRLTRVQKQALTGAG
jgi:hypothetical protein